MSIPQNTQVEQWRLRWRKYPNTPQTIADILKGNELTTDSFDIKNA